MSKNDRFRFLLKIFKFGIFYLLSKERRGEKERECLFSSLPVNTHNRRVRAGSKSEARDTSPASHMPPSEAEKKVRLHWEPGAPLWDTSAEVVC